MSEKTTVFPNKAGGTHIFIFSDKFRVFHRYTDRTLKFSVAITNTPNTPLYAHV